MVQFTLSDSADTKLVIAEKNKRKPRKTAADQSGILLLMFPVFQNPVENGFKPLQIGKHHHGIDGVDDRFLLRYWRRHQYPAAP
mmetsp:Transcript_37728/g.78307  ORF Transcript_37728/g.78307 Transcript_37728/m.78307 type:complete len:84 (+) Transcript_37728:147-398(+)